MTEEYGNFSWQIFVYSTYIITALSLIIYIFFSLYTRKSALKNIQEEGFFEGQKDET